VKATAEKPEVILRGGKPAAVILDIDVYEEMLERLEDAADLRWLQKMRQKPTHYRRLDDFLKENSSRV
jgi:PHD/YefM family antitoxin component YafN of YafNO toxin-antitoxin module